MRIHLIHDPGNRARDFFMPFSYRGTFWTPGDDVRLLLKVQGTRTAEAPSVSLSPSAHADQGTSGLGSVPGSGAVDPRPAAALREQKTQR